MTWIALGSIVFAATVGLTVIAVALSGQHSD